MRLILEKEEIVKILGKYFKAELNPDSVIIRTDPLEIEVNQLPLTDEEPPVVSTSTAGPTERVIQLKSTDFPKENSGMSDAEDIHPAAILAASKALEEELKQEKRKATPENRAGAYSLTPPPYSDTET